ncbi:MAG: cupin domain-containing protein [Desulfuromonadaceae bacterium]|nr:cupin domain-containing protein [Desulfuromonadaceae bacterium]
MKDKMIVKFSDGYRRNFLGVDFVVLACGQDTMIAKMLYKSGDRVPPHKHPNEQSGYVLSGQYRLCFGELDQVIGPGDSYSIPNDMEHSIEIIESGEIVDCFSPPRKDYW